MLRQSLASIAATLLLATAAQAGDAAQGKVVFQRCAICHRVDKGGGNGLGPNLFGVVNRKAGTVAGFSYSAALKSSGLTWTTDKLTQWVAHPAALVPGNRMAFAGLNNPQQQADVVAYLQTLK
ncbi:MAG TPA: c-type cytochrome [Rhizomicrobium sp.]|nr:c-type cytochrome [Rhizomicrobium sp.]